jgi:hypothetical protein
MSNFEDREAVYDLVGYLVSSAKELVVDPKMYGPFRLIDAASRVIGILEQQGAADDFLLSLRDEIDEGKYVVMTDEAEFIDLLNQLVLKVAAVTQEAG